jgi:hypothetical protein
VSNLNPGNSGIVGGSTLGNYNPLQPYSMDALVCEASMFDRAFSPDDLNSLLTYYGLTYVPSVTRVALSLSRLALASNQVNVIYGAPPSPAPTASWYQRRVSPRQPTDRHG